MKQYEAVIEVMEKNGGYATFGLLYQKVLRVRNVAWKTKTPFASMRRIVQDKRFFFKIKPGLWALKSYRDRLPVHMLPSKKKTPAQKEFTHSYYQGLLVEVGNLKRFNTFIPSQDRNKIFLGDRRLGALATRTAIYPFTYKNITDRTKAIDVVWFNRRRLPASVFEVEHTTDMKNALVKFVELQDFRTDMVIVADASRRRYFDHSRTLGAFEPVRDYVRFWSYQQLSDYHSNLFKTKALEERIYSPR